MPKNTKANIYADGKNYAERDLMGGSFNIICDGFANKIVGCKHAPNLIIGDMDSLTDDTKDHFESRGTKILYVPDQNTTDLEKALLYCIQHEIKEVDIYNALGGRVDHNQYNLGLLKKYHEDFNHLRIINDDEEVIFVSGVKIVFEGKIGARFSAMAFNKAKISSKGLKYDMDGYELIHAHQESACNFLDLESGEITVLGDALLIIEVSVSYKIFK